MSLWILHGTSQTNPLAIMVLAHTSNFGLEICFVQQTLLSLSSMRYINVFEFTRICFLLKWISRNKWNMITVYIYLYFITVWTIETKHFYRNGALYKICPNQPYFYASSMGKDWIRKLYINICIHRPLQMRAPFLSFFF